MLRVLDPIEKSPFVVPTIRKEAPTGNALMGTTPLKAVTNRFPQVGGTKFQRLQGSFSTHPPNDSSKASLSPPVGGRLCSFRRDWKINKCSDNVLNIIINGYVLPFISKPKLVRAPLIHSGLVISTGIRISGYPNPEYLPESEITYPSTRI